MKSQRPKLIDPLDLLLAALADNAVNPSDRELFAALLTGPLGTGPRKANPDGRPDLSPKDQTRNRPGPKRPKATRTRPTRMKSPKRRKSA